MTTTTSRPVSMIFRNYNPNPVIDARRRWSWCMRSSLSEKTGSSANGVVFLARGGGLDVLRDERQGVFLSGAGAFGALAG
jgi:hypothetical protein